ncbi:hypothetical protein HMI55_000716 [Coelomomyces lativittatus]|nr:hypothetical protein HMI55_000716 [Coelomomyces lativittatus]
MTYYGGSNSVQNPNQQSNALLTKFREVDSDKNGHINCYELHRALYDFGYKMFNEETCRLMVGISI